MSTTQYGFYYDADRCIGCRACVLACKDWNDNEAGESVYWRHVTTVESGKVPNLRLTNQSLSCNHCAQPACMAVCPAKAISKRSEDGIVVVDQVEVHRLQKLRRSLPLRCSAVWSRRQDAEVRSVPG